MKISITTGKLGGELQPEYFDFEGEGLTFSELAGNRIISRVPEALPIRIACYGHRREMKVARQYEAFLKKSGYAVGPVIDGGPVMTSTHPVMVQVHDDHSDVIFCPAAEFRAP